MENEQSKTKGLPENAYRELKPGETYRPLMSSDKVYPEVTVWSVGIGILMTVIFSAAAAFLGLKVGQVFEAAIPIAIIAVGVVGIGYLENSGEKLRRQHLGKKLAIIAFCMPFCYAIIDATGSFLDIFFLELETSPLIGITEDSIELVANVSYEFTFALVGLLMFIFMKIKGVAFGGFIKQKDKALAAVCPECGEVSIYLEDTDKLKDYIRNN